MDALWFLFCFVILVELEDSANLWKSFVFFAILIRIEECSNFWKTITFRYANSLGRFPQVFRQVKKWLILGLHEMIRVLHLNVYLVTVFLFCFTILVGRVKRSNLWKMLHFKQFLAFGFFSSSSWAGWGVAYIRIMWNYKSATYSAI